MNIYEALWSRIGGRPWTFISRDVWHKLEYIPIVFIFLTAFFIGFYWPRIVGWAGEHPIGSMLCGVAVFTIGYILGHFFWGKKYIPFQGKKR
jgi:hypothetical protein